MIISGVVIKGKKKGIRIGFPTANLRLKENIKNGVYSGKVFFKKKEYKAGIFIRKNILEAHAIDFKGDLYGKKIEVEIGEKIREARKFKNNEELKRQIKRDIKII